MGRLPRLGSLSLRVTWKRASTLPRLSYAGPFRLLRPSTAGHECRGGPKPPTPLLSGCFVPSVPAAQCDIYGFLLRACAEAAIIPAVTPSSLGPESPMYPI